MEPKDLNPEFKATVNKRFEDLNKLIGPNRQQLSTKVYGVHREILKELGKEKISAKRQGEILIDIIKAEKMAHQQLPAHLVRPAAAPAAAKPKAEPKAKEEKPVAAKKVKAAPKKAAPKKK